jgi:hypothetical protein
LIDPTTGKKVKTTLVATDRLLFQLRLAVLFLRTAVLDPECPAEARQAIEARLKQGYSGLLCCLAEAFVKRVRENALPERFTEAGDRIPGWSAAHLAYAYEIGLAPSPKKDSR